MRSSIQEYRIPNEEIIRLHDQFEGMIVERAKSFAKTTGLLYDDVYSEARYIFYTCCSSWQKDKSSFSTWLRINLNHGLTDFCKAIREISSENVTDFSITNLDPAKQLNIKDSIEQLSDEAKFIVDIIFKNPEKALENTSTKWRVKLREKLRAEHNWSWGMIWKSFKEIKDMLKDL